MKRLLLLSLALFFCAAASTLAANTPESAAERKFSFTAGSSYGFLVNGTKIDSSHGPGVFLSLDYALDSRSSLFLDYHAFATASDTLGSVGYKYWLAAYRKIRPWVQVAAGAVWNKSSVTFPEPDHAGREKGRDFQFSFGGGARYELADRIGLNALMALVKAGAPWHWSNSTKLISTSFGVDVLF